MSGIPIAKSNTKSRIKTSTKTRTKKISNKRVAKIKVDVNGKPPAKTAGQRFFAVFLIVLPLVVGVMSTIVTGSAMMFFYKLNQPPLAPPAWLFPVAWTILYILMGVASYLIYKKEFENERDGRIQVAEIVIYFAQLFFNFMWTILFFRLEARWFAFGWLVAMWIMVFVLICLCVRNNKAAGWCLVPYIIWCTFAMYLNAATAILN